MIFTPAKSKNSSDKSYMVIRLCGVRSSGNFGAANEMAEECLELRRTIGDARLVRVSILFLHPIYSDHGIWSHMVNPAVKHKIKIFGSGEMANLTRAFDWGATPLGPMEQWPETLIVLVNALLANLQPMLLFWGPELIQFYNDAFRPSLGSDKHPKAVGRRAQECWAEIWEMIGPQIDAVMSRGEACWFEDQLVPFYREGKLENIYWTYS